MKTSAFRGLVVVSLFLIGPAKFTSAQNMGMTMPTHTLLLAQLDSSQVANHGSTSDASGTGAFMLDSANHSMEYSLTYQGLEHGGAKRVALHNFGRGANGDVVAVLCGEGASPCPASAAATLSGAVDIVPGHPFDNHLVGEFDSGRIYVEIVGGAGNAEIRGQLGPNTAMVPFSNFVARLAPIRGETSKGSGTAILSEVYLPDRQIAVFFAATVAGTSSAPKNASYVAVPTRSPEFTEQLALPDLKIHVARGSTTGGSLSAGYNVNGAAPNAPFADALMADKAIKAVGIVVTTSRFPKGELFGTFVPVR